MSEETEKQDYMEKARELADSYPRLLAKRQELKQQIDESSAWFYTREEVIYKLSQGAHEQGERVKTSGTSNPVEHRPQLRQGAGIHEPGDSGAPGGRTDHSVPPGL